MVKMSVPVRKSGWMQKLGRSGMVKNWKKRYFILQEGKLTYYTDELGENVKGFLELVNTEIIQDKTKKEESQIWIQAYSGENSLLVMADSSEEANSWREWLNSHIEYANELATLASTPKSPIEFESIYKADEDISSERTSFSKTQRASSSYQRASTSSSASEDDDLATPYHSDRKLPDTPPRGVCDDMIISSASFSTDLENSKELGQYVMTAVNSLRGEQCREVLEELKSTLQSAVGSLVKNAKEKETGNRDEKWLVAPILLSCLVLFGSSLYIRGWIRFIISIVGLPLMLIGVSAMVNSVYELRGNNSLFAPPVKEHNITTGGMFSVIRHPYYGGVTMLCLGLAFYSLSAENIVLSIVVSITLDNLASIEEKYLLDRYPTAYRKYSVGKRKLIPFCY